MARSNSALIQSIRHDQAMTQAITSLSQFFSQMGVKTRIYDIGRRITKISAADFSAFEEGHNAYPAPYLHQAWLGLVFWEPDNSETPMIWFLRFPLDEQGKLLLPERDKFLQMLLTAVGDNLKAARDGEQLEAVLEGNPYVFTPPPERQAAFHARLKASLQLPPSQFYDTAKYYLETAVHRQEEQELWQAVGLQGLADIAVRWNKKDTYGFLLKALPVLPAVPFASLCECLENEPVDAKVTAAICRRLEQLNEGPHEGDPKNDNLIAENVNADNAKTVAAAIRGFSNRIMLTGQSNIFHIPFDARCKAFAHAIGFFKNQIPALFTVLVKAFPMFAIGLLGHVGNGLVPMAG